MTSLWSWSAKESLRETQSLSLFSDSTLYMMSWDESKYLKTSSFNTLTTHEGRRTWLEMDIYRKFCAWRYFAFSSIFSISFYAASGSEIQQTRVFASLWFFCLFKKNVIHSVIKMNFWCSISKLFISGTTRQLFSGFHQRLCSLRWLKSSARGRKRIICFRRAFERQFGDGGSNVKAIINKRSLLF